MKIVISYLVVLFMLSITQKAEAQKYTTKIDSLIMTPDLGWATEGPSFAIPSGELMINMGLHFTPRMIFIKNSPYFFEAKILIEFDFLGKTSGIGSMGLGYTKSNYLGRIAYSAGYSHFGIGDNPKVIKVTGSGIYATAALYAEPYIPFGIGLKSSIYIHPKQIIATLGISLIFDGAKSD